MGIGDYSYEEIPYFAGEHGLLVASHCLPIGIFAGQLALKISQDIRREQRFERHGLTQKRANRELFVCLSLLFFMFSAAIAWPIFRYIILLLSVFFEGPVSILSGMYEYSFEAGKHMENWNLYARLIFCSGAILLFNFWAIRKIVEILPVWISLVFLGVLIAPVSWSIFMATDVYPNSNGLRYALGIPIISLVEIFMGIYLPSGCSSRSKTPIQEIQEN